MSESAEVTARWWLYLLLCKDGRTYVGIATDVLKRLRAHQNGSGARFTRSNPPLQILGACGFESRSAASKAEHALKKLSRTERLTWAVQYSWDPDDSARSQ